MLESCDVADHQLQSTGHQARVRLDVAGTQARMGRSVRQSGTGRRGVGGVYQCRTWNAHRYCFSGPQYVRAGRIANGSPGSPSATTWHRTPENADHDNSSEGSDQQPAKAGFSTRLKKIQRNFNDNVVNRKSRVAAFLKRFFACVAVCALVPCFPGTCSGLPLVPVIAPSSRMPSALLRRHG